MREAKDEADTLTETSPSSPPTRVARGWAQLRIWHFACSSCSWRSRLSTSRTSAFGSPLLIALAAGGLVLYGLIGWIAWWAVRRFESRLGPILVFVLYSVAMGLLFLVATIIYLVIAHIYRGGGI